MRSATTFRILTANDLLTGLSVFLAANGSWTNDCREACVAFDDASAASLEAAGKSAVAANKVIGPYLVEVEVSLSGALEPVHYRERVRAQARPSFWPASPAARNGSSRFVSKEAPHVSL